jgi:hypothetical protein
MAQIQWYQCPVTSLCYHPEEIRSPSTSPRWRRERALSSPDFFRMLSYIASVRCPQLALSRIDWQCSNYILIKKAMVDFAIGPRSNEHTLPHARHFACPETTICHIYTWRVGLFFSWSPCATPPGSAPRLPIVTFTATRASSSKYPI